MEFPSQVSVCNLALVRLGGKTISAITDQSREAQLCNVLYTNCLYSVLREFPWNFATKWETLGQLSGYTLPQNWTYAYSIPTDCVRSLEITIPGTRVPRPTQSIPYEFAIISGLRVLLCDEEEVELKYTGIPDVTFFDPLFVSALAWNLAMELASPLMGKPELGQAAKKAYLEAVSTARAANLSEGSDQDPESELLSMRNLSI